MIKKFNFFNKKDNIIKGEISKSNLTLDEYINSNFNRIEFLLRDKDFFNKVMFISHCGPNEIKLLFDRHSFILNGEYHNKFWPVTFQNKIFLIVSANGRGTTIESEVDSDPSNIDKETLKIIRGFVYELTTKLLSLDTERTNSGKTFLKLK